MFSDIPGLDRAQTKNQIRDTLLLMAADAGHPLSKSRANNIADNYKKGVYDPVFIEEMKYILHFSDPTGETAVNNVLEGATV